MAFCSHHGQPVRAAGAQQQGSDMTLAQWLNLILQASIMLTVLGLGLTASFQDASFLFERRKLLGRAALSMMLVMPAVAIFIATTIALPFEVKVALVALSLSPVPPIIQKKQITAGGRETYAVGLLVAMSLLAIVLVPLWVIVLDQAFDRQAAIGPLKIAKIMLMTVLAPLIVGLLIRRWRPSSERAAGPVMAVGGIFLVVGCAFLVYGLWPTIRSFLGNGVLLMLIVLAVIGLAVGHLLGGPRPGDRTSLALATSSRHPAVALAIATSGVVSEPKPELAIILLYLLVATVVSLPYQRWRKGLALRNEARGNS
jgi:bile acid:Na+ symporter, BASS family